MRVLGKSILVVDDDRFVREGLRELLQSRGHSVETAEDGYEAVSLVEESNYDLILLDLVLPGMNGVETLKTILMIRPRANVIAMTAYSENEVLASAMTQGAKKCLLKPVKFELLENTLREVLVAS
ncbi:MAG TPA: response regulator [bacterium]|nr:response regulator [bacterium]